MTITDRMDPSSGRTPPSVLLHPFAFVGDRVSTATTFVASSVAVATSNPFPPVHNPTVAPIPPIDSSDQMDEDSTVNAESHARSMHLNGMIAGSSAGSLRERHVEFFLSPFKEARKHCKASDDNCCHCHFQCPEEGRPGN